VGFVVDSEGLSVVFCGFDELVEGLVEAQGFVDDCETACEFWENSIVPFGSVVAGQVMTDFLRDSVLRLGMCCEVDEHDGGGVVSCKCVDE